MDQATFEFDPTRAAEADPCDAAGFELGWDHAHHGLVPPPGLLLDGTPVGQGWRAGKAVFGRRTLAATRTVRQWLALRTEAWRRGIAFETTQVTAHYLGQIETLHCPVTRRPLGGTAETAPVVARLHEGAGYAAGNLALVSAEAARLLADVDAAEALRAAARFDAGIDAPPEGFSVDDAWRAAVLKSFVSALPFAEAARVPMRVLPPNRVRVLNAVQGLQAMVTLLFAAPGWSTRVRALADLLPAHGGEVRHEFNLFVGAFVARLPASGADTRETRRALEDAWACGRVVRRWQQFALALGEGAAEALLARAAEAGLAGVRTLVHAPAQATEGWSLASRGRVLARPRRAPALAPKASVPAFQRSA
jgi:hypothetical protein